ncbi:MAG: trigger factor [Candidatus Aminicenantaceae bacterium]
MAEKNKQENSIKNVSQCKKEIELEIPKKDVENEFQNILSRFSTRAKIHGFRPGKAPKDIVKRMFLPDIEKTLIDSLVPKYLTEKLKELKFNPINIPVIRDLYFKEGEPLRFKAYFEVLPDFDLPDYKKINVKKKDVLVSEKEVDQSLHELQERSAEYIPAEGRGVVDGDFVLVEIRGRDIKSKKFLPTERVLVQAGHVDNEKLLNENLRDLNVGEEKKFVLTYDKNHKNKSLAGKEIEYNIKVVSIKNKKIPQLDDDFAKGLGEYKNINDLKKKVKQEILISKENAAKKEIAEEVIEKIAGKINIELPETLVEKENLSLLQQRLSQLPRQELSEKNIENLKDESKKKAEKNLKNHLILRKIAEVEDINVSKEEEDQELKALAKANNISLAEVTDSLKREGRREEFRNNILLKKTVDFLVKQSIIE